MKKDKKNLEFPENPSSRQSWTMENALYVLHHPTVDSRLWAEAVEWLIIHGPEDIRESLLAASAYATQKTFPQITPSGCAPDGQTCFTLEDIAEALETDAGEVEKLLKQKEQSHGMRHGFDESETTKIQ